MVRWQPIDGANELDLPAGDVRSSSDDVLIPFRINIREILVTLRRPIKRRFSLRLSRVAGIKSRLSERLDCLFQFERFGFALRSYGQGGINRRVALSSHCR